MKKGLLLLIATMAVVFLVSVACEMDVRTKCDDTMDYRIEAYNDWIDDNDPDCKKITREKEKKPWPSSAYDFYEDLMADYCVAEPGDCQLESASALDASKSAIQDCFGDLLKDAEACYTYSVVCQENLTEYLDGVGCLTPEE